MSQNPHSFLVIEVEFSAFDPFHRRRPELRGRFTRSGSRLAVESHESTGGSVKRAILISVLAHFLLPLSSLSQEVRTPDPQEIPDAAGRSAATIAEAGQSPSRCARPSPHADNPAAEINGEDLRRV